MTVSGSSVSAVVGLVFLCICVILASQLLGFRAISGDRTGSSSGTQGVELSECDHGCHALIQTSLISLHNPEQDDTASPANVQASALLLPSGRNPRCHAQSFCATVMGYLGTRRTPDVQDVSGQDPLPSNTPTRRGLLDNTFGSTRSRWAPFSPHDELLCGDQSGTNHCRRTSGCSGGSMRLMCRQSAHRAEHVAVTQDAAAGSASAQAVKAAGDANSTEAKPVADGAANADQKDDTVEDVSIFHGVVSQEAVHSAQLRQYALQADQVATQQAQVAAHAAHSHDGSHPGLLQAQLQEGAAARHGKRKHVALAFYGLTRSLTYTIDSIHSQIMVPLSAGGYTFDIYLHTYDLRHLDNSRTNESSDLNTTEWHLLRPDFLSITSQVRVPCAWPWLACCQRSQAIVSLHALLLCLVCTCYAGSGHITCSSFAQVCA